MRAALARAALAALLVLPLGAFAAAKDDFDFEAAGGAVAVGPMHGGAVKGIAEFCSAQLPDTADAWAGHVDAWQARNAPWVAAGEEVKRDLVANLRAAGEDPAALDDALAPMVQQFVDQTVAQVTTAAKRDGAEVPCQTMAKLVESGGLDVEANTFTKSIDLLRQYLSKSSP